MPDRYEVLDNPVWYALQTVHKEIAQGTDRVQRYPRGVLQFLAFADPAHADVNEILPWTSPGEKMIVVGDMPPLTAGWNLLRELDCTQMICERNTISAEKKNEILELNEHDHQDMLSLINLVQPGFFFEHTPQLGSYFGIRQEGDLLAVAGERTKITGWTEVSAVCTHPSFTGRGYAQQLVAHIVDKNIAQGTGLYLHLLSRNERARKVYELLGFRETRKIPFTEIIRTAVS